MKILINEGQYRLLIERSPLLDLIDNSDIEMINFIRSNFPKKSKILEIACGNGEDALHLKKLGYYVVATDINSDLVDLTIKKGVNAIIHNTTEKFPFNNKEFDLVYSRLGLHYFTKNELFKIFSEISRISNAILFSVKIEQDNLNTGKVILSKEDWKEIVSKFFIIKEMTENEGKLYGMDSKWLTIFAKK